MLDLVFVSRFADYVLVVKGPSRCRATQTSSTSTSRRTVTKSPGLPTPTGAGGLLTPGVPPSATPGGKIARHASRFYNLDSLLLSFLLDLHVHLSSLPINQNFHACTRQNRRMIGLPIAL